nr:cytochrome P450 3A6-like [Lytechinus pictus]
MDILADESSGPCLTWWLVLAVVTLLILYLTWTYTYFLRRGIRGPLPLPLFGNVLGWREGIQYAMDDYIKKYGNCCGFYQFLSPAILVSDPDMIKQIMVKHFDRFHNRMFIPIDSPLLSKALFISSDEQWKKLRHTLTPAFSGKKMKLMSEMVKEPASRLVKNLMEVCGEEKQGTIDLKESFGAYIMDTIALCAFGLNVDSQKNKDDPFVRNAKKFFSSLDFTSPALIIYMLVGRIPGVPGLLRLLGLNVFPVDTLEFFKSVIDRAIEHRRTDKSTKNIDFLQLVLDSTKDNEGENDDDDDSPPANHTNGMSSSSSGNTDTRRNRQPLTRLELTSQALAFFVAGYETTTTALTLTAYLLATNPDQQDRLIDEIDRLAPTAEDINYESLKKLVSLENIISESLRLYPPGAVIDRVCNQTTTINGHEFRAGDSVSIPIWSVQRDPNHWPNPEKFDPDRFNKENAAGRAPLAWLPFGGGPRFCIGLRFAMMEIRTALVMLLQQFRLEVAPETEIPPVLGKAGFINPPNGVTLRVVERSK